MAMMNYTEEEWKIYNELKTKAKKLNIDDARIIWPNFSGAQTQYNDAGERNFCVRLDSEELVNKALEYGYNVKYRDNGEDNMPYLQVKVIFGDNRYPCKVFMKSGKKKPTPLTEDTVSLVDNADILKASIVIQPKPYVLKTGRSGISARLNALYLTVSEDKYADEYFGYDEDSEDEIPFD